MNPLKNIRQARLRIPVQLAENCTFSAAIYRNSDNVQVRTLLRAVPKGKGTNYVDWDGKNDFGELCPPVGYHLQYQVNNVACKPAGLIANTSDDDLNNVWNGTVPIRDIVFWNNWMYAATGYSEGQEAQKKCLLTDLGKAYPTTHIGTTQSSQYADSDGIKVYYFGWDEFNNGRAFIYCLTPSGTAAADTLSTFTNGTAYTKTHGHTYPSVIDLNQNGYNITHMRLMGNFILLAEGSTNTVHIYDKASGSLVQHATVAGAYKFLKLSNTSLLIAVAVGGGYRIDKYSLDAASGNLTYVSRWGNSSERIQGLSINPTGNTIRLITSAGQRKIYQVDGTLVNTKGTANYYASMTRVDDAEILVGDHSCIAHQPDGRYWVVDTGNYRTNRFGVDDMYTTSIAYFRQNYQCEINRTLGNDTVRIYSQGCEFEGNPANVRSFRLTRNFNGNPILAQDNATLFSPVTLNGRDIIHFRSNPLGDTIKVYELTDTGLVELPTSLPLSKYKHHQITAAGNLRWWFDYYGYQDQPARIHEHQATGFLQWDTEFTTLFHVPKTNRDIVQGTTARGDFNVEAEIDGIFFMHHPGTTIPAAGDPAATGYHLQGIKGNKFLINAYKGTYPGRPTTAYPTGWFDLGNTGSYYGNRVMTAWDFVTPSFHGEGRDGGQCYINNVFHKSGLLVQLFGTERGDYYIADSSKYYPKHGVANNALCPVQAPYLDANGGKAILQVANTETGACGLVCWTITNLDSVKVERVDFEYTITPGLSAKYYDSPSLAPAYKVATGIITTTNLTGSNVPVELAGKVYSAVYSGFIHPKYVEATTFSVTTADRIMLWVDETLVIDGWDNTSLHTLTGTYTFGSDAYKSIRIEQGATAGADLFVKWQSASLALEVIPVAQLAADRNFKYADNVVDLLENLPFNGRLQDGRYGVTRFPLEDRPDGNIQTVVGYGSWDWDNDKSFLYSQSINLGQQAFFRFDLGDNKNIRDWTIYLEARIRYMDAGFDYGNNVGAIQLLDRNGKLIFNYRKVNGRLWINNFNTDLETNSPEFYKYVIGARINIQAKNGKLEVSGTAMKRKIVVEVADNTCDIGNPKYIAFVQQAGGSNRDVVIRKILFSPNSSAALSQNVVLSAGQGVEMRSPNGNRYVLSVSDAGAVVATLIP